MIDRYDLTRIDLDIEGAALAEPVSIDRRNAAVALLQAERPGLEVAYCLPVLPTGLTAGGLGVLSNALAHGVEIGWVNIMAMDYGEWAAPDPEGMMAEYAIEAAEATLAQLQALFRAGPSPNSGRCWGSHR